MYANLLCTRIMKTRLFKYIKNFTSKNWTFSDKKKTDIFLYFCSKHRLRVLVSTHNLCFWAEIKNNVYPCKPQFYYIKVEFKGAKII